VSTLEPMTTATVDPIPEARCCGGFRGGRTA
jgi:hypothetical protein